MGRSGRVKLKSGRFTFPDLRGNMRKKKINNKVIDQLITSLKGKKGSEYNKTQKIALATAFKRKRKKGAY